MSLTLKARYLLVSAVVAGTFVFPAYAQYSGPSEIKQPTVAEILENPTDDQDVQVQGHLLRQIAHKKFIFSDGTGEIVVEIEREHFVGQPVDNETRVELIGEVDTSSKHPPEIEVDSLRVIQ